LLSLQILDARRFGAAPALTVHLTDPRFAAIIQQDALPYKEVVTLAKYIAAR
jgi:hypothetical protein